MMAPKTAIPPITPPAMAPTGVDFLASGVCEGVKPKGGRDDEDVSEMDTGPVDGSLVVSGVDAKPSEPTIIS
jgi:hypothetical protein